MSFRLRLLVLSLAATIVSTAVAQEPPRSPTWDEIRQLGIVPYRQLTVDDFPADDTANPNDGFYVRAAVEPRYHFILKPHTTGFVYAYVDQWMIFSGLNTKRTSRKSTFKTMKAELPYAQAILDLSELYARQLAALKPGELPSGRGATPEEARADMEAKIKRLLDEKFKQAQSETEAFAKATKRGADKKKVRELASEIRKRLEATPALTVPDSAGNAVPAPTPK